MVNQWGGSFPSQAAIHIHEAERSLDLIYENFRENKKLLLKKAVVSFTERNGTQGYSTERTSVITERLPYSGNFRAMQNIAFFAADRFARK